MTALSGLLAPEPSHAWLAFIWSVAVAVLGLLAVAFAALMAEAWHWLHDELPVDDDPRRRQQLNGVIHLSDHRRRSIR